MIDINLIREKPEWVKAQIARLNDRAPIDEIVAADARRREIIAEVETDEPLAEPCLLYTSRCV